MFGTRSQRSKTKVQVMNKFVSAKKNLWNPNTPFRVVKNLYNLNTPFRVVKTCRIAILLLKIRQNETFT